MKTHAKISSELASQVVFCGPFSVKVKSANNSWFIVYWCSHCLWGFCFWSLICNAAISVRFSFAPSHRGREGWLLYFNCALDIMWLLGICVSSSWCFVCWSVNVAFTGHTQFPFSNKVCVHAWIQKVLSDGVQLPFPIWQRFFFFFFFVVF